MCCVMPPLSPLATSMPMIRSNSDVLPWSTCPRNVITGGRSSSCAGSSGCRVGQLLQTLFHADRLLDFNFHAQFRRPAIRPCPHPAASECWASRPIPAPAACLAPGLPKFPALRKSCAPCKAVARSPSSSAARFMLVLPVLPIRLSRRSALRITGRLIFVGHPAAALRLFGRLSLAIQLPCFAPAQRRT